MTEQLQLSFTPPSRNDPRIGQLIAMLTGAGWRTSRQVAARLGWSDRTIRALASASAGRVISGQLGYKLTREATIEEIRHATAWLRSQAAEMQRRALEIDRIYHGKR